MSVGGGGGSYYVSSSSHDLQRVKDLAAKLPGDWHLGHDWTLSFKGDRLSNQLLAHLDLICAVEADVFIFLDSEVFSRGGMMEYGARLASGGSVVHIGCNDPEYMFFNIPQVSHYGTVEGYLRARVQRRG